MVVLVEELHVEGTTEVLTEEVAGTALQRLAILHHCFDGVGVESTCEALGLALDALHDRHCHHLLGKFGIDLEHETCTLFSLLARGVSRVTFLPEEFCRAQEQTRAHLPTHDIAPLIDEQRQVAVGMNPILVGVPDDGLGGRTDDEFFFQFGLGIDDNAVVCLVGLQTVMGNYCTFFSKAFYVLCLARKK